MKIIAHTPSGYIVEMLKSEMQAITGKDDGADYRSGDHRLEVGSTVKPTDVSDHLKRLDRTAGERARIAEQLRTLAKIVEKTPVVVIPPKPAETAPGVGGA